jgi:NHL repeat
MSSAAAQNPFRQSAPTKINDSSLLTKNKQTRVIYSNALIQRTAVDRGVKSFMTLQSASVGSGGPDNIISVAANTGSLQLTPEQYAAITSVVSVPIRTPGVVTTLAGDINTHAAGNADGTGAAAQFNNPIGVACDSAGNVYVADTYNHCIRKVTPAGVVTTFAGSAESPGNADGTDAARFNYPNGVACDSAGYLYVADTNNHCIRKVTPAGVVTTLAGDINNPTDGHADGTGAAAQFYYPSGVACDSAGNVYVADKNTNCIRKITPAGVVTTLAGNIDTTTSGNADGTGIDARFAAPSGVACDSAGNVYVADTDNNCIRKITPAGVVTTLAGNINTTTSGNADGPGIDARFYGPSGVACDSVGNVYVADSYNHCIRKVTPAGDVTTLAGNINTHQSGNADGIGPLAMFYEEQGVACDSAGNVYVGDSSNHCIRKVTT